MQRWVLDCSAVMALLMSDEDGRTVEKIFSQQILNSAQILVPTLFWFELCNSLTTAQKRNRISIEELREHEVNIADLPIVTDSAPDAFVRQRIREFALAYELSVYDAAYLELADRTGSRLKTYDGHLLKLSKKFSFIE